jgi:hypothetical protein
MTHIRSVITILKMHSSENDIMWLEISCSTNRLQIHLWQLFQSGMWYIFWNFSLETWMNIYTDFKQSKAQAIYTFLNSSELQNKGQCTPNWKTNFCQWHVLELALLNKMKQNNAIRAILISRHLNISLFYISMWSFKPIINHYWLIM